MESEYSVMTNVVSFTMLTSCQLASLFLNVLKRLDVDVLWNNESILFLARLLLRESIWVRLLSSIEEASLSSFCPST